MTESNTITIPKNDLSWMHKQIDQAKAVRKSLTFLADLLLINPGMDSDECEGLAHILTNLSESLQAVNS